MAYDDKASPDVQHMASEPNGFAVHLCNVTKTYGALAAVNDVSLTVPGGSVTAVVGPSGSGKTTLLGICSGAIAPSKGAVRFDGRDVTNLAMCDRDVGVVFQHYALFPHMTVYDNVGFPLRVRRRQSEVGAARERVTEMLRMIGLGQLARRYPNQLSGGQQQRVALARALVFAPRVLLLDEPFAATDPLTKAQLRTDLAMLQEQYRMTVLLVTHDVNDAMQTADHIVVLDQGRLVQYGAPKDVHEQPGSRFVACFLGATNQVEGPIVASQDDEVTVQTPLGLLHAHGKNLRPGDVAIVALRPDQCELAHESTGESSWPKGVVTRVRPLGDGVDQEVRLDGGVVWHVRTRYGAPQPREPGVRCFVKWPVGGARAFRALNGHI